MLHLITHHHFTPSFCLCLLRSLPRQQVLKVISCCPPLSDTHCFFAALFLTLIPSHLYHSGSSPSSSPPTPNLSLLHLPQRPAPYTCSSLALRRFLSFNEEKSLARFHVFERAYLSCALQESPCLKSLCVVTHVWSVSASECC